jgi:outer membrane protein TolC
MTPLSRFRVPRLGAALLALAVPAALHAQLVRTGTARPLPLSLSEALALGAGGSEAVALARAGVERAEGQQRQARSAQLPQLSSSLAWQKQLQNQFAEVARRAARTTGGGTGSAPASGGTDSSGGGDANSAFTRIFASEYNLNAGLVASQPLFTGGRGRAGVAAARAGRQAAEVGVTAAEAQAQLDVTAAYYDALLADRLVTIAESTLVQAERTLRQVQLTRSVGSASEFELLRARVTRDNQRPGWLQARTARELAYVRLRQLLNLPPAQAVQLTDSIVEVPASASAPAAPAALPATVAVAPAEVLALDPRVTQAVAARLGTADTVVARRAPVQQAQLGVEVAQQQLRAVRGQRYPQLAATSTYQRFAYPTQILPRSLGDFFPNWTVGVGVSWPLFSGGRLRGEIQAAEAGVVEARQRLRQAEEGADLDTRQAVLQLAEAEAAWLASVGTAEQAQRAYEIADIRFAEGISTQLELSEIRVQWQQALANRARAARDLQVARTRLALLPALPLGAGSTLTSGSPR